MKLRTVLVSILIVIMLVVIFFAAYTIRSSELDKDLEVTKEMVDEVDNNRINYIKITTEDKVYKSVEDYEKVAKAGDIVKCDIVLANGEHKTALNGYVIYGEHTGCRLEGDIVKISVKGGSNNASK